MHDASFNAMSYVAREVWDKSGRKSMSVLDVGSMIAEDGQRTYKEIFEDLNCKYAGLDMAPGLNVDVVAEDPYKFPLHGDSIDWVISGQAFEHIEYPWLTIREIERVLKPGGIASIIAPSSGPEHRYPQDCWRFYPDGMRALAKWANLECLYAETNWPETQQFQWGDTIGIFYKPGPTPAPQFNLSGLLSYKPPKPPQQRKKAPFSYRLRRAYWTLVA